MKVWPQVVNQTINLAWTIFGFAPVLLFWSDHYEPRRMLISLALCLPFLLTPRSVFNRLQISKQRRFYERIGVRRAQAFTQNGLLTNRLIKKKMPEYALIRSRGDLHNYGKRMTVYNVYHITCLAFFMISAVWALTEKQYGVAILIFICNIPYNVYPLLIQQYNRIRIRQHLE